jgi:hypothetical protein
MLSSSAEMRDLHLLLAGSRPDDAVRNSWTYELAVERCMLRELAEGWPCYRDACEWENFHSIFHPEAHVYTTWTGLTHHLKFIEDSQAGMDNGAFIMHRAHGSTTDINREAGAESDCRFIFFWQKMADPKYPELDGQWRAWLVRHRYEKDKLIPLNPSKAPLLDEERLQTYSSGYRYLAYLQEDTMGANVLMDLPGHRRERDNVNGKKHDVLYWQAKDWVEGRTINLG